MGLGEERMVGHLVKLSFNNTQCSRFPGSPVAKAKTSVESKIIWCKR